MTRLPRIIAALSLLVGCAWLLISFDVPTAPERTYHALGAGFLVLSAASVFMDWRDRKTNPIAEPSPAFAGTTVVILTGTAAVIATASHARTAIEIAIPVALALGTAATAVVVFRFARRNAQHIGDDMYRSGGKGGSLPD